MMPGRRVPLYVLGGARQGCLEFSRVSHRARPPVGHLEHRYQFGIIGTMAVDWKSWGLRLQALRRERGWSQEDLAAKLDVARNTVNRWEMGERHPSMKMLEGLAAVLNVTGRTLLPTRRLRGPDPDATVPAHLFEFDAALLFRFDEKFSLPLARLMMATDDIRHLRKLLIVQHEPPDGTPSEKAVVEGEVGHLFRLLCGHLFEAIGVFADLNNKCRKLLDDSVRTPQSEAERARATTALEAVRRERAQILINKGRRHFIATVRNIVGFHYPDDQKLKRTLAKHLWHDRSDERLGPVQK